MPVAIRLSRIGRLKVPFYRIVAADSRSPRDGKFIELLGTYDPRAKPNETDPTKEVSLRVNRIKYWLGVGAQPSDTVNKLLAYANLVPEPVQRISAKKMQEAAGSAAESKSDSVAA